MDEQDRDYVMSVAKQVEADKDNDSDLPYLPNYSIVVDLLAIIDRLQHRYNKLELELARVMTSDIKSTTECLVYMREKASLKSQLQKMQALLERCKALFYDDAEPRLHLSITGDRVDEIYKRLGNDIKTLLKEAKVVKHGEH